MVTLHVTRRRACPAPVGRLTSSSGERDLKMKPTQANHTRSKLRYCFYPWERLTVERRKSSGIGKVESVLPDYPLSVGRKRHIVEAPASCRRTGFCLPASRQEALPGSGLIRHITYLSSQDPYHR